MPGGSSDIVPLVRVVMFTPAAVMLLWWWLVPGIALDKGELAIPDAKVPIDSQARLRRIEEAFDAAAVPAARRSSIDGSGAADRERFRSTVRRAHGPAEPVDGARSDGGIERFGISRRTKVEELRNVD